MTTDDVKKMTFGEIMKYCMNRQRFGACYIDENAGDCAEKCAKDCPIHNFFKTK